jgi:2-dehydropantoate 2-reductase
VNIAILGAGAMGSVYGAFLAGQPENKVTLINTWKEHIEAINQRGLIIISNGNPDLVVKSLSAVTSPQGLPPQDLVLVCVKATATQEAMTQGLGLVGPSTVVLTLQNGLGNIEKLCRVLNPKQVMAGVNSYASSVKGPGEVILAARGEAVFGELDGHETGRLKNIKETFERASLSVNLTSNVKNRIWTKLISNIAINALAAILDVKNGELLNHPESEVLMIEAINEAVAVAKAEGVTLETDDPVAYSKKVCHNSRENICSMLQDVRAKKKTEIDVINGAIVELATKYHIPTPINLVLTNLIKVIEQKT